MTRLNVYAGPAGFFLVRGGPEGEKAILDNRTDTTAVLPGPAPNEGDKFPSNKTYYEFPIAIQDRSFNSNGSLFYPESRAFFDGVSGPYIPESDVSPIWNPEFFGNTIMVNGNTWPTHTVEQRRYRLRVLNGCQSRFLILDFSGMPGIDVWQIGNEGGFLAAAVNLTADNDNRLLLGPAERADLIIDFTAVPLGDHVLGNLGPDEPFGGGTPGVDFDPADPNTTGQIMRFHVIAASATDPSTPPRFLQLPPVARLASGTTRRLALLEQMSESFGDAPAEARLGTVTGNPNDGPASWTAERWEDPVTTNPAAGTTEVWEFYNAAADAHPMHIHEVLFQVVNRQAILLDETTGAVRWIPTPPLVPHHPGRTDGKTPSSPTQPMSPGCACASSTPGQFVWHCHIVEHEDNEMMRPYRIGPAQPGQPDT